MILFIFCLQVKEIIFCESNHLVKSIQTMLGALNKLRSVYVTEIVVSQSTPVKVCMNVMICNIFFLKKRKEF